MTPDWDTLAEGDATPVRVEPPLTITDFVRYQGASGDLNPIHHDPEFARKAGYDGPFAVGMLSAGLLAAHVAEWLGPENIRKYRTRFSEQAWPGDVLTYGGRVTRKRREGDRRLVEVELSATRQTGGVHLRAWATFEL
jgi:acyl dehydratase